MLSTMGLMIEPARQHQHSERGEVPRQGGDPRPSFDAALRRRKVIERAARQSLEPVFVIVALLVERVEELGRVGRLKWFLAQQLAELIVSQGNEKILESRRREIVVVFCDLRGYTAFTETTEPEEVLSSLFLPTFAVMSSFHRNSLNHHQPVNNNTRALHAFLASSKLVARSAL